MAEKLTDAKIANFRCKEGKQVELRDSVVPGLTLRASPGGTKSFYLIYRFRKKPKREKIGKYGIISLSDARERARELLSELERGKDPKVLTSRNKFGSDAITFDELVDEYVEKYARHNNRRWKESKRVLTREFGRHWQGRCVRDLEKHEVTLILDEIVARGSASTANQAFAAIRRLFNWAIERGNLVVSPCNGMKPPAPAVKRERVLSRPELKQIWQGAKDMGYPYGIIVQLLILTAQRREEVAKMRWQDLDFDRGHWNIPAELNKSKRLHVIPLTDACIEIIASLPRFDSEIVFLARGRNVSVSGFSKWKRKLDEKCSVKNWRLHDIRRTVATEMAALGVDSGIIERILNHADTSVTATYNKFSYLPQIKRALELWSNEVANVNR